MLPVSRALPCAALAALASLVTTACASDGDRLARIEERLDAMDRRVAEIDERTKPRLWVPTADLPWPVDATRWIRWSRADPNGRFERAPDSWWPILEDGGCVFPLGTRPATIRRIELLPVPTVPGTDLTSPRVVEPVPAAR